MLVKSLLVVAGTVVVGVVGYKIIKKNPKLFENCATNIKKSTASFLEGIGESFKEGYASAAA